MQGDDDGRREQRRFRGLLVGMWDNEDEGKRRLRRMKRMLDG